MIDIYNMEDNRRISYKEWFDKYVDPLELAVEVSKLIGPNSRPIIIYEIGDRAIDL